MKEAQADGKEPSLTGQASSSSWCYSGTAIGAARPRVDTKQHISERPGPVLDRGVGCELGLQG